MPEGTTIGEGSTGQPIMELADRCLIPVYRRQRVALARGQGCRVWDTEGRAYLDFIAGIGVLAVGHCHPRVVHALTRQAGQLWHTSNLFYTEPQARLAEWLVRRSPFDRAFFCNSGAEAVEAAIKLARRWARERGESGRFEIVTAERSFHGRTLGALSATGQRKYQEPFEPLVPGFRTVPFNDAAALAGAVGPSTAAILLEPVQGEGGVYPADPAFLRAAREIADRAGALLILDEVQTGLGRTGRLFAFEHFGIVPDAVALAKALGGGTPIGALLAREPAASVLQAGQHASTFGGNPLVAATALATLQVIEEEGLVGRADAMGRYLSGKLQSMSSRTGHVRQIRGLGLMVGVETDVPAAAVVEAALRRGLLVNAVGPTTVRMLPPLVVGPAEIDEAVDILGAAILEAAGEKG
ncbi:acetylornithine transaminase [Carboxydochorda subterranea]|uniref:Acetylornithine aminotransferase n=1 Tax=Carboxydichorda subterranea TaxID=3109565 RepID=A0ABZ1BUS8_9FIRM|nr:acetylornithine transaminase [Limnochorda sp. L945t]WRP16416.1 acetylornithine transaminase [Limnochorda sp. L945t]